MCQYLIWIPHSKCLGTVVCGKVLGRNEPKAVTLEIGRKAKPVQTMAHKLIPWQFLRKLASWRPAAPHREPQ